MYKTYSVYSPHCNIYMLIATQILSIDCFCLNKTIRFSTNLMIYNRRRPNILKHTSNLQASQQLAEISLTW